MLQNISTFVSMYTMVKRAENDSAENCRNSTNKQHNDSDVQEFNHSNLYVTQV